MGIDIASLTPSEVRKLGEHDWAVSRLEEILKAVADLVSGKLRDVGWEQDAIFTSVRKLTSVGLWDRIPSEQLVLALAKGDHAKVNAFVDGLPTPVAENVKASLEAAEAQKFAPVEESSTSGEYGFLLKVRKFQRHLASSHKSEKYNRHGYWSSKRTRIQSNWVVVEIPKGSSVDIIDVTLKKVFPHKLIDDRLVTSLSERNIHSDYRATIKQTGRSVKLVSLDPSDTSKEKDREPRLKMQIQS
jgi:hypothetical protein